MKCQQNSLQVFCCLYRVTPASCVTSERRHCDSVVYTCCKIVFMKENKALFVHINLTWFDVASSAVCMWTDDKRSGRRGCSAGSQAAVRWRQVCLPAGHRRLPTDDSRWHAASAACCLRTNHQSVNISAHSPVCSYRHSSVTTKGSTCRTCTFVFWARQRCAERRRTLSSNQ